MNDPIALNVLQPDAPQTPRAPTTPAEQFRSRLRPHLLRLYRLAVVASIVWIIHRHHTRLRVDGDAPIRIDEVKPFFAGAARLAADDSDRMGLFVLDSSGNQVGYVLRTSPLSDKITGYAGPTDTLVALDRQMKVIGIRVRSSWDTKTHLEDVVRDEYFMNTWNSKSWEEVAGLEPRAAGIEGVSGASLTSLAIANAIHHRFKHSIDAGAPLPPPRFSPHDIGLVIVIAVALLFSFTSLRGQRWLRLIYLAALIGYVGFWNGQLLAQSLLSGWSASSVPWRLAPGLVLLAAAALIVPWTTRRALYCSHICPHGAAQELLGRLQRKRIHLHKGLERGLLWLPPALIVLVLTMIMLNLPFDPANIEPFDAYLIRTAGAATIAIAVVGLIAAAVVPMAYCKYGCPTGLLLAFVRSHGKADRFTLRDTVAGLLVALVACLYYIHDPVHQWIGSG